VTKAADHLQMQDRIIKSFPEVASVFGKAGRASTAPAPTEMYETVINLKPKGDWPPGVTIDFLISDMDRALQFPGVSNPPTCSVHPNLATASPRRFPVTEIIATSMAADGG
jgi:copper/silver efflux system protein